MKQTKQQQKTKQEVQTTNTKQKKFSEEFKRYYQSLLRYFNMVSSGTMIYSVLPHGENKLIDIEVDIRKEIIKNKIVQELKDHGLTNGYKIVHCNIKPIVTQEELKKLLDGVQRNTIKKRPMLKKIVKSSCFFVKNSDGTQEKIMYSKVSEKLEDSLFIQKLLKYEKYFLATQFETLTQREKNLYFSLSKYFDISSKLRNLDKQINDIKKDIHKVTDQQINDLSIWLGDFLESKQKDNKDNIPFYNNMVKSINRVHKETKAKTTYETLIYKKTIDLFKKSNDNKERFFKLLNKQFSLKPMVTK